MKKIISFVVGALMLSTAAWADSYVVDNKGDFGIAWNAIGKTVGQKDTIIVTASMGGINVNTKDTGPQKGVIYIIGQNDEDGKVPRLDLQIGIDTCTEKAFSLIFENLTLSRRSTGTGEIVSSRSTPTYIDTLAFRNCEVLEFGRWPYRSTCDGGNINYFEVSGCTFHDADGEQEMFRFSQSIVEAVMVNNTFYNLPNMKALFALTRVPDEAAKENLIFTFENNDVFVANAAKGALIQVGSCAGMASEYYINNNLFLYPDWVNDMNLPLPEEKQTMIFSGAYGSVFAQNNVIENCRPWTDGMIIDEEGEGAWLNYDESTGEVADITGNMTMAEAQLDWSDFAARESGDFSIWNGHNLYTAGIETAYIKGKFIGAERWYTDTQKIKASFSYEIEGSQSAKVNIDPMKDQYFIGDEITLTADCNGLNTFNGWSDGNTDLEHKIVLEGDLAITARFTEIDYLAAWNLDQLTKNNEEFASPLVANYTNKAGDYTLAYAGFDGSDSSFVSTRNNKFSSRVLDLRNCVAIRESSDLLDETKTPGYVYIKFPTKGCSDMKFHAVVGTDGYCSDKINLEYSLDGLNWTPLASAAIKEAADSDNPDLMGQGLWFPLEADLPATLEEKDAVWVRVIADTEAGRTMTPPQATGDVEINTYFLYVGEIRVSATTDGSAIEEVKADEQISKDEPIYDIMGRRVFNVEPNRIYIQKGKKFIQK